MSLPETVEIEPQGRALGSVIWLHGLGADGHDFEPIVPELRLPARLALRFVFPHAPVRPVTLNGGLPMRAWFDIRSLDSSQFADEAGMRASALLLEGLIRRETERGVAPGRIVLAGFSQGGAIAMQTALCFPERLRGLIALSTFLPLPAALAAEFRDKANAVNAGLPVFMAHGRYDPLLPRELGRSAAERLIDAGFDVAWHDYPMAHAVCAEEIDDLRDWLLGVYADAE